LTGDEKLLEATFKRYSDLLDSVSAALEVFPVNTEGTIEEHLKRLIDHVNRKQRNDF
jgi:hypothetical protein